MNTFVYHMNSQTCRAPMKGRIVHALAALHAVHGVAGIIIQPALNRHSRLKLKLAEIFFHVLLRRVSNINLPMGH